MLTVQNFDLMMVQMVKWDIIAENNEYDYRDISTWKSTMERISLRHSMRKAAQTYRWKCEKPSASAWQKKRELQPITPYSTRHVFCNVLRAASYFTRSISQVKHHSCMILLTYKLCLFHIFPWYLEFYCGWVGCIIKLFFVWLFWLCLLLSFPTLLCCSS